ncbi:MAG: hypothetical protein AB7G11_01835 [Phycisphaerales bacterium]
MSGWIERNRRRRHRRGVSMSAAVLCGALACCQRTTVTDSLDTTRAAGLHGDEATLAELDFLDRLSDRPVVTNAEGFYALVLHVEASVRATAGGPAGGEGNAEGTPRPTRTYAERVAEAKRLGWLEASWDEPGSQAMQRGTLARALAVICRIKGGVMMRVVGPTRRYATRELAYLGILSAGSEQQPMTGGELISILSKAQDYQILEALRAAESQKPGEGAREKKAARPAGT